MESMARMTNPSCAGGSTPPSCAGGDASHVSDWDLLILVNQPLNQNLMAKIRDHLYDLELETDMLFSRNGTYRMSHAAKI